MKKARIILTMMMVFAIVGGVMAFRTQRLVMVLYKPASPGGSCTIRTLTMLVLTDEAVGFDAEYSNARTTTSCPTYVTLTL
jgi:hypothetical protein